MVSAASLEGLGGAPRGQIKTLRKGSVYNPKDSAVAQNSISTITDQHPPPFDLNMSDDALVTFGAPVGPGALSFTDVGYMPINDLTIGGDPQQLKGKLDGLFIQYNAEGVQHFAQSGAPTTADYTDLHFELMGYKGDAVFGHAADGTPTVDGTKHLTVLAQGDLITGQLGFGPTGGITGDVNASFRINGRVVGTLDLSVQHAAGDIGPNATGFTLNGGTLHATFAPLSVG